MHPSQKSGLWVQCAAIRRFAMGATILKGRELKAAWRWAVGHKTAAGGGGENFLAKRWEVSGV